MYPYIIGAVDPGMISGFSWYDPDPAWGTERFACMEDTDPTEVYGAVQAALLKPKRMILLVEDFIGSGNLTAEAKQTVKILGAFQYGTCGLRGIEKVVVRVPQMRLAFVDFARNMMKSSGLGTVKGNGADALSALAHCLSYNHEINKHEPFYSLA